MSIDLRVLLVWIVMGSLSCLYNEITWGMKRCKVIENLKNSNSIGADLLINLLDNHRYVVIILEYTLAPLFFILTLWDVICIPLGKNEAYKK